MSGPVLTRNKELEKPSDLFFPAQLTNNAQTQRNPSSGVTVLFFSDSAAVCSSSQFHFIRTNVCFSVHSNQAPALWHSLNIKHIAKKKKKKESSYSAADLQSTHVNELQD